MPARPTEITAAAALFSNLFLKGQFEVPWHQRYYDWTREEVLALLADVDEAVKCERSCYFLGAVILVERENGVWEINDGQQRMITVSLICAALCRRFSQEEKNSQRLKYALEMLFKLDEICSPRLDDADHYETRIQPSRNDSIPYRQMLRGNSVGADSKLKEAWQTIEEFLGVSNQHAWWETYFDYICKHLEVAYLIVPPEIDPSAVFETINCRGKLLDDLDLVRNFIYSHFNSASETQRREMVHANLERILDVFPRSRKNSKKAEEYVRCCMQSRFGFLARSTFYRDLRRTVRSKFTTSDVPSNDFLFKLSTEISRRESLELYKVLTAPRSNVEFVSSFEQESKTSRSERRLTVFLRELKDYKVTHTLAFALLEKYISSEIRHQSDTAKIVSKNLSRLATFVMRTAFMAPKFEPSHFEKRFADYAAEIRRRQSVPDQDFASFLIECDQSEHRALDDDRFRTHMIEATMQGNQKIKALLLGINRYKRNESEVLNEVHCSVEHILPKGKMHWSGWNGFRGEDGSQWIHRIGNMTLIARSDNKSGVRFNRSFADKRRVYADSSVAITRAIASRESWSPDEIMQWQRKIADQAVKVWLFE